MSGWICVRVPLWLGFRISFLLSFFNTKYPNCYEQISKQRSGQGSVTHPLLPPLLSLSHSRADDKWGWGGGDKCDHTAWQSSCFCCLHPTRMCACVHSFFPLITAEESNVQTQHDHCNVFHAWVCKVMMKVQCRVSMKEEANCVVKPNLTSMTARGVS